MISACIPTYAPFFRAFASNISSYRSTTHRNTYVLATRQTHSHTHTRTQPSISISKPSPRRRTMTDSLIKPSQTHLDHENENDNENGLEILDDGTTMHKGGGHSTTIMSLSMPVSATGRGPDSDSEELIRDRDRERFGSTLGKNCTPPDTAASTEDPLQIHTMTEVKVERHEI